jgi:hypothetical protein
VAEKGSSRPTVRIQLSSQAGFCATLPSPVGDSRVQTNAEYRTIGAWRVGKRQNAAQPRLEAADISAEGHAGQGVAGFVNVAEHRVGDEQEYNEE